MGSKSNDSHGVVSGVIDSLMDSFQTSLMMKEFDLKLDPFNTEYALMVSLLVNEMFVKNYDPRLDE
jgi:hypothetical protein